MKTPTLFELDCQAMNYEWGKLGTSSLVAQLLPEQTIEASRPYAELWMGIHPNGPSRVKFGNGEWLSEVLIKNQKLLGHYTLKRWGTLPFLFKVLSITKPLSIQMHPHKSWAETLHANDPIHYPDSNHKPEIALALSGVETLYGFEDQQTIAQVLQRYPFLQKFHQEGDSSNAFSDEANLFELQNLLPALLHLPKKQGNALLKNLYQQIQKEENPTEKEALFLALFPQFPQDLGLLFLFFMQKIPLASQTALFLRTNQLHAYLSGDLIECMANSDNVIRAGITNKFKDVDQMLTNLVYQKEPPELSAGISDSDFIKRYPTAAEEFLLETIELPQNKTFQPQKTESPAILLTLSGSGQLASDENVFDLKKGTVLFIGANQSYRVNASQQLHLVKASVPVSK